MTKTRLDGIAKHLVTSYLDTAGYSVQFADDHETPPSHMAKVHHLRSVVQALLDADDRFTLHPRYIEYGRVHFTEVETGDVFALRSVSALQIEQARTQPMLPGLDLKVLPTGVQFVIYKFTKAGVEISLADAARRRDRDRLYVVGEPRYIDLWPYLPGAEEPPFDQFGDNPFDFLGDIGDVGDDEAGGQE